MPVLCWEIMSSSAGDTTTLEAPAGKARVTTAGKARVTTAGKARVTTAVKARVTTAGKARITNVTLTIEYPFSVSPILSCRRKKLL